jgi:hypothetical protein
METMETQAANQEKFEPRDTFRLNGNRYIVDITGFKSNRTITTSGSCEYSMYEWDEDYVDLHGVGLIIARDGSIIQKFYMDQSKTRNSYDSHKVDFLSQVFLRSNVNVSEEDYADAVAEHLLAIFDSTAKGEQFEGYDARFDDHYNN